MRLTSRCSGRATLDEIAGILEMFFVPIAFSLQEDTPKGEAFGCRYEAYLTDYRTEPRKTKWQVDLAIRLRD
jgi:hypothetical protein